VTEIPIPRHPDADAELPARFRRELRLLYRRRAAVEELIRAIEAYEGTRPLVQRTDKLSAGRTS
jgi:hypothetical protein